MTDTNALLARIADALDRLAPKPPPAPDFAAADAFVWRAADETAIPVPKVNRVDIALLKGVDRARDLLLENTARFARGFPANNALLWGARGMGKSSLVKAAHAAVNATSQGERPLKLIEIHREDIESLPALMARLRVDPHPFLVFCDDLSFDGGDASYKSLKAALEGGVEGRPAINPGEAVEEKVSLSDRFGLWLGFHKCSQDEFLEMVFGYCTHFKLAAPHEEIEREALEWATTRGSRSGRTAWQFVQDLAGRLGVRTEG